jgi:hypothetical protein
VPANRASLMSLTVQLRTSALIPGVFSLASRG